jgi:hypothetical protein
MSDTRDSSIHCPYLGLKNRSNRWIPRPEERNHCHRPTPPQPVAAPHQSEMCLSANHAGCPVFQRVGEWEGPLPPEIQSQPSGGWNLPFLRVVRQRPHTPEPAILAIQEQQREGAPNRQGGFRAGERMAHRPLLQARQQKRLELASPAAKERAGTPASEAGSQPVAAKGRGEISRRAAKNPNPLVAFLIVFVPLVAGAGLIAFALFGGFDALAASSTASEPTAPAIASAPPLPAPTPSESPASPPGNTSEVPTAATLEGIVETTLRFDSNLRSGPGSDFEDINFLTSGARVVILGHDESELWLLIRTENGQEGWIAASQVAGEMDMSLVPLVPDTASSADGG